MVTVDRYFNTDSQFGMFKRDKAKKMDILLGKYKLQNSFSYFL